MIRLIAVWTVFICLAGGGPLAADPTVLDLWPEGVPSGNRNVRPEREIIRNPSDGVMRLTEVSQPQITVYRPEKPNGAAVLVCPGGGYKILAYEHEGTKVCEFFNQHGVTAVLLKYRVPAPRGLPLQDAQRALGLVHQHADEWGIDRSRVGMLGFSAGGHLTLSTCLHAKNRTYEKNPVADVDDPTPAFAILVYPAYLVARGTEEPLVADLVPTATLPPLCLIHAADDPWSSSGSALLAVECKKLKTPCEVHIYAKGGHGFGMKRTGFPVDHWPDRVIEWMDSLGLLQPAAAE